jgi:1-acyl-sn-glycerol-3-phosphate acyltransferase
VTALRALWRIARVALHALHGLAIVVVAFRALNVEQRRRRIRWWSARLFDLLGARLEVIGDVHPGATLLAANHISWLDVAAIHAVAPHARFVSKAEVRHWPLINRLVDAGGTLYIERSRARDAMRVVHEIAAALRAGETVAVFPEGTTTDGRSLLPFHANLLQAAISTATPIQPVALRFSDATQSVSTSASYVGDTTLLQSVWSIARAQGLRVKVSLLLAESSTHGDRRALAARIRELIAAELAA